MSTCDIAIVGISFELPQQAKDEESFWQILQAKKNLMTEWPQSRINIESFHSHSLKQENKVFVSFERIVGVQES
jgi:acyl transferase domain-containing protein